MAEENTQHDRDLRLTALLEPGDTPGPSSGRTPSPFDRYREHDRSESEASAHPQVPPRPTETPPVANPQGRTANQLPTNPPNYPNPQGTSWVQQGAFSLPMPDPGTPGAPFFNGEDATEAPENFERLCKRRGIVDATSLCELFPDYCEKNIRRWAKSTQAYVERDWATLKHEICEDFKDQDSDYQRFTRTALIALVQQPHDTDVELRHYLSQFTSVASVLLQRGMMLEWQCCEWLLSGLPEWLRTKVVRKEGISFEDPSVTGPIRLGWITKVVNNTLTAQRREDKALRAMAQAGYQQQPMYQEHPQVERKVHQQEGFSAEKPSTNQIPTNQQGSQQAFRPPTFDIESAFKRMDQKFKTMSLDVNSLKASANQQYQRPPPPAQRPYGGPQNPPPAQAYPQEDRGCYYCGAIGHYQNPQSCKELAEDLSLGNVHYNGNQLCVGRQSDGGPRLSREFRRPFKESLSVQLANWNRRNGAQVGRLLPLSDLDERDSVPGAQVPMNYLAFRLGTSPELNEEIDDDDETGAGVHALGTRASQDAVRKRRRENGVASTRSYEAGRYEPARVEEIVGDEEVMMDSPPTVQHDSAPASQGQGRPSGAEKGKGAAIRKQPTRTQLMQLDEDLEEDIKHRFLSTKVEISLEEMAKLSSRFRRTLFTEPKENRQPNSLATSTANSLDIIRYQPPVSHDVPVNGIKSQVFQDDRRSEAVITQEHPPRDVYSLGLLQTDVIVGDHALEAMFDTGSCLDVIGLDLANKLRLPIKKDPQLHVLPVNGVRVRCLGCIQNMPISIGDITVYVNAIVIRQCGLILGRPFMEASMMALAQKPDGKVDCVVYNRERTRKVQDLRWDWDRDQDRVLDDLKFLSVLPGAAFAEKDFVTPVRVNLMNVRPGSVVDLDNYEVPPEWNLIEIDNWEHARSEFNDVEERGWDGVMPLDVHYRTTVRESDSLPRYETIGGEFIRPKYQISKDAAVHTLYKRKADKVKPVSVPLPDGSTPEGQPGWQERCLQVYHSGPAPDERTRFDSYLRPRLANFARCTRLTPEREEKLILGKDLLPEERELLRELLIKREGVLAWSWEHIGRVHDEVYSPQKIRTIEHEAWQHPGFQVPRALTSKIIEMLQDRQQKGSMEPCHGPYRNPWFLVKKKAADQYRLVIAAMKLNSVTVRDANLPPNVDEFAEDFSGMMVCSMVDLFSGYDQITLARECRDMTAIQTPIGLLRMTTILQGGANSVGQCQRIVQFILADDYGKRVKAFLDDFGIKGPKTTYNDEIAFLGSAGMFWST
ncbi:hypothetical protein VN97_g11725 [Penicillium thymicola]|uniref:Peptidase A2 domain-containing protein n=1 Tax=Penicillium thymicola TaxID=293382 RepID=A0AAI9X373_PENTH|nr:hypothetical protein VN97_g11725 [Penicillium thymicola]